MLAPQDSDIYTPDHLSTDIERESENTCTKLIIIIRKSR